MNRVVVIEAPAALVDLATAKAHLRVDHDDDDAIIGAYIAAACGHIDGPGGWLGRAIGPQTLELRADDFRGCDGQGAFDLPFAPIIDVVSVKYLDGADGAEQTVTPTDYEITARSTLRPGYEIEWPTARSFADAVRIRYRAGYVADPTAETLVAAVPAPVVAAVLLMVGDLYANRETAAEGGRPAVQMSLTVERLLAPFRIWSV